MITQINFKLIVVTFLLILGLVAAPKIGNRADVIPEPVTMLTKVNIDPKQIQCMAKNIFYEAGSESINGQAAVARVVLNRIAHGFAKTPCGVIYQSTIVNDAKVCQFSWVCEGKGEPNKNNYQYKVAQQVAFDVMVHNKYNDVVPKSVLFFHNVSVTPLWPYAEALRIGNHIFYTKNKKKHVKPKKTEFKSEGN